MLTRLVRTIQVAVVTAVAAGVLLVGPSVGLALAAGPASQDIPTPPTLDETVFESALTGPDLFEARTCPTGAASGDYVGEGFRLRVRGRCVPDAPSANLPLPAPRVTMADND